MLGFVDVEWRSTPDVLGLSGLHDLPQVDCTGTWSFATKPMLPGRQINIEAVHTACDTAKPCP